jgi:hypothetical protein
MNEPVGPLYEKLLAEAANNQEAQAIEIAQLKEKAVLREKEIEHLEAVILKMEAKASV